jgi:hypothetical protein
MCGVKPGWTLAEVLVAMIVMSVVLGLVARTSAQQLRFYRSAGEFVGRRGQITSATTITARLVWETSPGGGDILVAQDSVLELRTAIGSSFSCSATVGRIVMPIPSRAPGNTLSAFVDMPDVGDNVAVLLEDSSAATWLTSPIGAPPTIGPPCELFPSAAATWELRLQGQLAVSAGAVLRFGRRLRLSAYHAADGRWYLGAKTWNTTTQQFNAIQPVAGPLRAYSNDSARTGLLFTYSDAAGETIAPPVDAARIAAINVTARAQSSVSRLTIALRNAP